MNPVRTYVRLFLSLSIAFLAASGLGAADSIRKARGETVTGDIVKETSQEVQINVGGRPQRISRREIAPDGITYDGEPRQLTEGRTALAAGDYAAAHQHFQSVIGALEAAGGGDSAKDSKNEKNGKAKQKVSVKKAIQASAIRPIFLQHALYGEVQTYAAEGKVDEVGEAVDALLKHSADSYYLLDALLLQARLVIARGDAAKVAEVAAEAEKRAAAAGVGAEVSDRISILRAGHLAEEKKEKEAQQIYDKLQKSPVPAVADMARLGVAQIQIASGNTGEIAQAKSTINRLLRESKERTIHCLGNRGLGDAQMKEMASRPTLDGLREALESYLRAVVSVKCIPADGDPTEPHQKAILSAAACAEELVALCKKDQKQQKDSKPQDEYRRIARDLYRDLISYYKDSEEAKVAREALKKLMSGAAQ